MSAGLLLLALVTLFVTSAQAELAEADGKFDKGLYQESLLEYERAAEAGASADERYKARYRACEAEALLFRYGEAIVRLEKEPLPEDERWRARFLILKSELYRRFLRQYAGGLNGETVSDAESVFSKSRKEIKREIASAYWALWTSRKLLERMGISGEDYTLDVSKADRDVYPTLYDFVIHRWSEYLLSEADLPKDRPKPEAISFIKRSYGAETAPEAHPTELAAALLESGARGRGKLRALARELWRIRRLIIPFMRTGRVSPFKDAEKASVSAAEMLTAWSRSNRTAEGRASAGFEAAQLLETVGRYEDAVRACEGVMARDLKTRGSQKCETLLARVRQPSLTLQSQSAPLSGEDALKAESRNLDRIYLRVYKTDPDDLLSARRKTEGHTLDERSWSWSQFLNRPWPKLVEYFVKERAPVRSWSAAASPKAPHHFVSTRMDLKNLEGGLYFVAASGDENFTPGESLLFGTVVNITDLVLVATGGLEGRESDYVYLPEDPGRKRTAPGFRFYLLRGESGEAAAGGIVRLKHSENYRTWSDSLLTADAAGLAEWPVTVSLRPGVSNSFRVDPLAEYDGSRAYWAGPMHFGFSAAAPIRLFAETDRPIYRPGQTVKYKITVIERRPRGYRTYAGKEIVDVLIRDANWKELKKTPRRLSPSGSFAGAYEIPWGRMLGRYQLEARIRVAGREYSVNLPFSVEEYKRPEFEVDVKEAQGPWKFGKPAKISGRARYYFGGPVPDAHVTVKVHRENYRPWFCWWWPIIGGGREEVARYETRTDEDGTFSYEFTPQPGDVSAADPRPARFVAEVEARDSGGRTLKAERSFLAGEKSYLFKIDPQAGFADGGSMDVETRLVGLDGTPMPGEGSFSLYRLEGDPETPETPPVWGGAFPDSPSLESVYAKVKNGEKTESGDVRFYKDKASVVRLKSLHPGAYRLRFQSEDPWGGKTEQSIIILAADETAQRQAHKIHSISLAEHAQYAVGETATLLVGSSELDALTYLEVWGGQTLLEKQTLSGGGVRRVQLSITEDHKGGATVRWFGVRGYRPRSGALTLKVPWKDKELDVRLAHDKVLEPGQKASWSLLAKDAKGRAVNGEALVKMFDRSLEYYAKGAEMPIASLYSPRPQPAWARGSIYPLGASQVRIERGVIRAMYDLFRKRIDEPLPPGLRLSRSSLYGGGMAFSPMGIRGAAMEAEVMSLGDAAQRGGRVYPAAKAVRREADFKSDEGADHAVLEKGAADLPAAKVRTNFAESAVFQSGLKVLNGKASFSFEAPERLTAWRVSGNVLTRDVKFGTFSSEARTRKELMVRAEIPRFFREGDAGTIKAVVHNESEAPLSGTVRLFVLKEGKEAGASWGVVQEARSFDVKPHGVASLAWDVKIPSDLADYKVRVVARAGSRVDAEERDLPVLPSRQRLIESLAASLNGDVVKTLSLKSLADTDASRNSELLQLQIEPQLILTVMNSLPFLVRYPYECTEQTLNRFVPLAIVQAIYEKYPAIAKAAAKIPKRTTQTPAWEADDPKRMMRLTETPWLAVSQGRENVWPVIDMLDAQVVANQKKDALSRLKTAQNGDGGFPWFLGGRSDPYMTLYVLAGFAEAQRYGVAVPDDIIRGALRYVMNEIPRRLDPEEGNVALVLYAAYVVTAYPESLAATQIPDFGRARKMARAWLDYADKHASAMTQLGKAYASYAYSRLGEAGKASLYLDRAMDGVREDETAGAYWQPEKNSWLWYHDTLETHAFMLRTLQSVRPKDGRIPGLAQWLVFNRKGAEWKSTKASAAAIYALLDFLKGRGALDRGDDYSIEWGGALERARVEAQDWMEKPLRWTKIGSQIKKSDGAPSIAKKGPGMAFASLTHIYTTEAPKEATEGGLLEIRRTFYERVKTGDEYRLKPLKSGDAVSVGAEVEVRLAVAAKAQFEYVHIKDPRGAGFEGENLLSGWKWDQLSRYEEPRDSLTNFFVSWLPHGEYVLRYRMRPTTPGEYRIGAATLQSMYAPEFAAHSSGFRLKVVQ